MQLFDWDPGVMRALVSLPWFCGTSVLIKSATKLMLNMCGTRRAQHGQLDCCLQCGPLHLCALCLAIIQYCLTRNRLFCSAWLDEREVRVEAAAEAQDQALPFVLLHPWDAIMGVKPAKDTKTQLA